MGSEMCIRDRSNSTSMLHDRPLSRASSLPQGLHRLRVYGSTCDHCLFSRLSEIGTLVPSCWANSETRYSSSHQRYNSSCGSRLPSWACLLARVWYCVHRPLNSPLQTRASKHAQEGKRDPQLELYRWWLEEYRVSLFAQQLGTKVPISDKRLNKQWSQVEP